MLIMPLPSSSTVRDSHLPSSGAELFTGDGRSLPLVGAKLAGEAQGGLARLVLEQRFENKHDETLRVTYRMPLPADGAVSAYEFVIDGRTIKGVVQKKADARERFEQAIASGHTAALLEQNRSDIFTQEIGNLPAGATLVARITIDQRLAWLPEGEWELRFPTVIGPRYVGGNDATVEDAKATTVAVAPDGIAARISIAIRIGDAMTRAPVSPSHSLRDEGERVRLAEDGVRLDRDIVLRWAVATRDVGLSLDSMRGATGDVYGLLTLVPPARDAKARAVARDLIVLLDTSGSMGGGPLAKAQQVLGLVLQSLGEGDRIELIEFSNSARRWQKEPLAATESTKRDAIKWVKSRKADGGTEMATGIREALKSLRPDAQRQVIVVTDGYIGGEQQIIRLLHEQLPRSCRLHVLGVGSAVNRSLATAMARAGRGTEVIAGLDEDAERAASRIVKQTKSPILVDVSISGSALVAHAPEHIPDVFEGSPIVAALALLPEGGELVVRGTLATGDYSQTIRVPARRAGEGNQAIAALYGRERVADLETRAQIGETVDREIEQLGLKFQISTRMTSWIAVDESRIVPKGTRHDAVPQELPYGTSAGSFGLRAGAIDQFESDELATMAGFASVDQPAPPMLATRSTGAFFARKDAAPPAPSAGPMKTMMLGRSSQSSLPSQPPATMQPRTRRPVVLLFLLLLAAIAALLWWLVL